MSKLRNAGDTQDLWIKLMAYKDIIFRICLGFTRNPWEAEDLIHDIYLKAHDKIGTLRNQSRLREWLLTITRNTCLDHSRKGRLRHLLRLQLAERNNDWRTPESLTIHREQIQFLKKAVHQLPAKLREVYILKEYGDLSYQEIAAIIGIKEGTVASRLNHARFIINSRVTEKKQ